MKKLMTLGSGCLVLASLLAAETGERHVEAAGGFSYCAPKGWTVKEFPGLKYKIAFGPAANGFGPNINVVDESAAGSLPDYVKGSLQTVSKLFKDFKNLGQADFKTDSGLKGVRVIIQSQQQGKLLRQTFFFLPGKGDKKFVVTCSALADGGAKLDEAFAASMKTFALEK